MLTFSRSSRKLIRGIQRGLKIKLLFSSSLRFKRETWEKLHSCVLRYNVAHNFHLSSEIFR